MQVTRQTLGRRGVSGADERSAKRVSMSRWPDDPTSYRPSSRWLGTVVVAVMLGVFAVIGTWMWMGAHHSTLMRQATGDWTGDRRHPVGLARDEDLPVQRDRHADS